MLIRNKQATAEGNQELTICEFCLLHLPEGVCRLGLNIPKTMKCREFSPGIDRFCAKPADFVSPDQIVEMAKFFGLERTELKKVKILAERRVADGPCELS